MSLNLSFLKNSELLFYEYITAFLKPRVKNIILWQNPFQNAKKKTIFDKRNSKSTVVIC